MNSIYVIHPYKSGGIWMFDDPAVGLRREPFVSGADSIIEVLSHAAGGSPFTLLFSATRFPDAVLEFSWARAEGGGNWYRSHALGMTGWLCPALLKYFDTPPPTLYVKPQPIKETR